MRANWREYLYFCTGKARKLSTCGEGGGDVRANWREYLYFCTGKARELSTCGEGGGDVRANWRKPCREREAHKPLECIQVLSLLALLVQKYKY